MFRSAAPQPPASSDLVPSSSPAFDPPVHPLRSFDLPIQSSTRPVILPIQLPAATLRPLAFRAFTKKHNLTLTTSALQALAGFIGKYCGAGWREDGLADKVLDEVAKTWKRTCVGVMVEDSDGGALRTILQGLEGLMVAGRLTQSRNLSRQESFASAAEGTGSRASNDIRTRPGALRRDDSQVSFGLSGLEVRDQEEDEEDSLNLRKWLRVIGAFEQPRFSYNITKKHFEKITSKPSLMPGPTHKVNFFRQKYHMIHQRVMRNETFQNRSFATSGPPSLQRSVSLLASPQVAYKITPIANLLGRSGSAHMLLGLLTTSPAGNLTITDLTGSIALDIQYAKQEHEDAWFCPGMIVIVDGIYEEEVTAGSLGARSGVGGAIGGKFIGIEICGPPCEKRAASLGISTSSSHGDVVAGGGFGWVDFLGVGSERAIGSKMRRIQDNFFNSDSENAVSSRRRKIVIAGEVNLDKPKTLEGLKKLLGTYAARPDDEVPFAFVLMGNFVQYAVMAGGGSGGAIEYKEYFDSLASILNEYPTVLQSSTFIFIPGDNDPWASSFSAGAATAIPRKEVPELFTSRVKRAFTAANAEAEKSGGIKGTGEAIWATNPVRLSLFGPLQEIVCFRDDLSGRLRRNAVVFNKTESTEAGNNSSQQHLSQAPPGDEGMQTDRDPGTSSLDLGPEAIAVSENSKDIQIGHRLALSVLDQGHLSPFPLSVRPVLWDFANSLNLYPLPSTLVLMDAEAPQFCVTYEGCNVINPGKIVEGGRSRKAKWIEYDAASREGMLVERMF
ncbi:MAG: DNA-directed DNA polymerase epsilon, subunit B [Vezdaea aestivalis]|nr:MAG: DNA-directed DNA polymerase epsilon, subunit B [Vezdaea aestivalis]